MNTSILKHIAVSSTMALLMFAASPVALAAPFGNGGGGADNRGPSVPERAPEPVTMIGLALGAAGVAGARWASRKSRKSPKA